MSGWREDPRCPGALVFLPPVASDDAIDALRDEVEANAACFECGRGPRCPSCASAFDRILRLEREVRELEAELARVRAGRAA